MTFLFITSLVTQSHVSKNTEYEQLHAEAAKSGMCDEDLPIVTGKKFFPPKKEKPGCRSGEVSESMTSKALSDSCCGGPTSSLTSTVERDSSLDSVDSKMPVPEEEVTPPIPFTMTSAKSATDQDPESSFKKRPQCM